MDQKLIKDLSSGDTIVAFYVLRKKELRQKKDNFEPYLSLEFGDSSGRIQGSLWQNITAVKDKIQPCDVVKIKGTVITYRDKLHLTLEQIRKATDKDNIEPSRFLPATSNNIEKMFAALKKITSEIKNPFLLKLIHLFLNDDKFVSDFCRTPAGKLWHHAYLGGLLEHTFSVMKLTKLIAAHYGKVIDCDLLTSAAFLHDIGKIQEFCLRGFLDYSTSGRLIGHINLGYQTINQKISQIKDFPENLKEQLLHCMLSHHGEKTKGSPVPPMTMEALILSYADELDSMVGAFQRIINSEKEPGKEWSNYVNLIDRFVYLGEDK